MFEFCWLFGLSNRRKGIDLNFISSGKSDLNLDIKYRVKRSCCLSFVGYLDCRIGEREMEGTSWSLLILTSFLLERAIWIWRKKEKVWHKIIELKRVVIFVGYLAKRKGKGNGRDKLKSIDLNFISPGKSEYGGRKRECNIKVYWS